VSGAGVFSSRALVALAVVCGGSLLIGLVIGALGTDITGHRSAGPDSFSHSALGHRALVELLRELHVPVERRLTAGGDDRGGMVIVAEPLLTGDDEEAARTAWDATYTEFMDFLVVLPKRSGFSDFHKPGWLGQTWLLLPSQVQKTMDEMDMDARVKRPRRGRRHWEGLPAGLAPPVVDDLQLFTSDELQPLWTCEDGMLAAWWQPDPAINDRIIVLSDPDLLANFGLARGDNARYALDLIDQLGGLAEGVVIDESVHGFSAPRSIWREFFRFPLSLVAIQLLLTGGALTWLAVRRFGAVMPLPRPHGSGQEYLIENTAGLLQEGGHGVLILQSYLDAAVTAVTRELRLDKRLTPAQARQRLLRIGSARGVSTGLDQVENLVRRAGAERNVRDSQLLAAAGAVQRWRQEMTRT